jgi:molybdopterin adenylyltransferase
MPTVEEHRRQGPGRLGFGILTVSSSRTLADDASGDVAERAIVAAGHRLVERLVVPDDTAAIQGAVRALLAHHEIDAVVLDGGTGVSPGDLTPEAVRPLLDREIEGFGELFRMLSYRQIGAAAMLSRALAGVVRDKAVFALPGSPKAVQLGLEELVLPEVAHLLGQARRAR